MPKEIQLGLILLIGYLVGTINGGYLLVKFRKKQDIREQFSGNAGARNVYRVMGKYGFIGTILIDGLKTIGIYLVINYYFPDWTMAKIIVFIGVFLGHCFPVFLGFRGGMGVVVYLASTLLILPFAIVILVAVTLLVYAIFRNKTLAGLLGMACIPVTSFYSPLSISWTYYFAGILLAILAFYVIPRNKKKEGTDLVE